MLILPQYNYLPYANPNVAAGNAVTSWSDFGAASTLTAVSGYRIVSAGYVVRSIVAPLYAAGMLYIRQFGSENNNLWYAPVNTTTYNATAVANVPIKDASEVAVVLQRTSQMAQVYYTTGDDTIVVTNSKPHGFTPSTIGVSGGPASTPVLEVEFVIHYELLFADDSDMSQIATPPPPYNAVLNSAAATVTSTLQPIVSSGIQAIGRQVVTRATTALATALFGPGAGMATRGALAITVD